MRKINILHFIIFRNDISELTVREILHYISHMLHTWHNLIFTLEIRKTWKKIHDIFSEIATRRSYVTHATYVGFNA